VGFGGGGKGGGGGGGDARGGALGGAGADANESGSVRRGGRADAPAHDDALPPRLRAARDLVRRLRRRDIYTCCGDVVLPASAASSPHHRPATVTDVLGAGSSGVASRGAGLGGGGGGGGSLRPEDVVVQNLKIDFAMGRQNPLERVLFYPGGGAGWAIGGGPGTTPDAGGGHAAAAGGEARCLPLASMSPMYAVEPIERRVRVFLKSRDPGKVAELTRAFESWGTREYGRAHFAAATPVKADVGPRAAGPAAPGVRGPGPGAKRGREALGF